MGRGQTGNETYIVELATALAARSDVEPIAYVDAGTRWPREGGPGVRELRSRSRYLRLLLELPVAVRRDRARLLHVQYVAPPISPVPIVATVHDVSFIDIPRDFSRQSVLRLRATVASTVRRAAVVLTVSDFTRGRLLEEYRLSPERVVVTPNGVAPRWRRLSAAETGERLAAAGLVTLPERFVLAVGNIHPRKNIARLVDAVRAIRAAGHPDVGLVLAGQRRGATDDVDAAVERSPGGWVRFLGYVPDDAVVALVNRATVVAYPSIYEGFGLPVLEAMACGAVVVAGNRTSIPEVAGDAALLVDPMSDDDLAAGLAAALDDASLRDRLALAGPRRAAEFTWSRSAELAAAAYLQALRPG
ncbi:MAG TPA: glycosyltransferase family 1 protein [Candidatus Limnocylindrales bacterium]